MSAELGTCRGCGAAITGRNLTAPPGYCCAWCELGLRCPCIHGRGYTLLDDDQPRLFTPPPPVAREAPS